MALKNVGEKDLSNLFYNSLKNSQPIAFLASLSMVIAVFAHNNIPSVYSSAIFATVMFVISFCISLWDQMYLKENPRNEAFYYGKIFFFGFGVFYLIKIALDFSKDTSEIGHIVLGWSLIAVSLGFYRPIVQKIGKFIPENYPVKNYKIIQTIGFLASSSFLIIAIPYVLPSIVDVKFDANLVTYCTIIGFSLVLLFIVEIILIKKWHIKKTN